MTPVVDVVVDILNRAVDPVSVSVVTDLVGFDVRDVSLAMLNPSLVITLIFVSPFVCIPLRS